MTLLAKMAISLAGKKAAARFDEVTRSVAESQERKLRAILERNADTEYGREFGFKSLRSLSDYARAVPIVKYDDIGERVKRMARGESNVLTAEKPVMFSRTSGTTGEPKLIPITPTCRGRDHADQMRTWLYHAQKQHAGIFQGKVFTLVSPAVEGHTESGIPYGSTSGHIYQNLPGFIRKTYVVPYPVFEIEDHDAEFYAVMRLGLVSDVTFLCTANPSSIAKLCEFTQEHADDLIRDIRDGTLSGDLEMPREIRERVEALCRPEPDVARALESARSKRDGKLLPADFWPNLQLIGCWKGGTVGAYVERFGEWFDPDDRKPMPVRDWGYLSSEARGSIPLSDEGAGGVLTVGTNVYEFVAVEELDGDPESPDKWTFLGAHEVDAPRDYYVFLTTTGGLYRYDINDIVRVEDFYNDTPVITFQRKGRGMTSVTGEKVADTQVIEAVTAAASQAGARILHFRALADAEAARYIFQVEPEGELSEEQGRTLLSAIEEKLTSLNIEYQAKRKSERLEAPELHVMKHGWYDKGKESKGARIFQAKTVVLQPKDEEEYSVRSQEMLAARIELSPGAKSSGSKSATSKSPSSKSPSSKTKD